MGHSALQLVATKSDLESAFWHQLAVAAWFAMMALCQTAYPAAVEALIHRVQRVAASRSDPLHVLAATISMAGIIGLAPYAVLASPSAQQRWRDRRLPGHGTFGHWCRRGARR